MPLQNHSSTFIHKNESIPSATSILFRSAITHNTTASLENLTCINYVDFGNAKTDLDNFLGPKMVPTTWI